MRFEDLIGVTPLYQAAENLFLKIEYANLTGSVKDRAALAMILDGERQGMLKSGGTIIEPTSGNMGISLAAIAANRGYKCIIVMPDTMSVERQKLIKAYGATVILTPGDRGMAGAVERAKELSLGIKNSWMANQFENSANVNAHYCTTGPEIWAQTGGKADVFVAGVGTGGTITGTGRYLKEKNPNTQIIAVEPAESPLLSQGWTGHHGIQGIGANFVPKVLDLSVVDQIVTVTQEQAITAAAILARQGIFCGISSGAAYHVTLEIAMANSEKRVVTILPDSGNRYLSTLAYYDEPDEKVLDA